MDNNYSRDYWAMRLRLEELLCKAEECVLLTEMLKGNYKERIEKEECTENAN